MRRLRSPHDLTRVVDGYPIRRNGGLVLLFELAMELDVRSAEMADAAPALGLEGLTPTSELTPEQVQVLRARFTKVPVAPGPGGPSNSSSYRPPNWGPPAGAAIPPPAPLPRRGMGAGQIAMIVVAVVAVVGLFGYMAKNGGTDQDRLDRIAATDPADVTVTGPDGKPLTKEEKANLAKLEAAVAEQKAKVCPTFQELADADEWSERLPLSVDTFEEIDQTSLYNAAQGQEILDRLLVLVPEQAANIQMVKEWLAVYTEDIKTTVTADDVRAQGEVTAQRAVDSGWYQALLDLDAYAKATCGVVT